MNYEFKADVRDVVGYKGLYSVDNMGNVYSVCYNWRGYGERKLKTNINKYGYATVSLTKESKSKNVRVHKIVAEAFLGNKPDGLQIRHLDGNKLNNNFENLKYGTAMENAQDREIHGNTARGERIGTSKLTDNQVNEIRSSFNKRGDMVKLSKKYGVSVTTIYYIIKGIFHNKPSIKH